MTPIGVAESEQFRLSGFADDENALIAIASCKHCGKEVSRSRITARRQITPSALADALRAVQHRCGKDH